ncbi:AAA family ATPase [Comamonadaceae bacterium OH2545_COT-014]|nr:AAA family ATPase [Comamonadaceae bacterium OH2545_COT-014]
MNETETATARPSTPAAADPALAQRMAARQQALGRIAAELKEELFGIDDVIDRVIDAVRAWWVLPEIITRPVIVCLWGLTGTGKTQLTRRLAQKMGFYDRFVEVQMDGFSHGWDGARASIAAMLDDSGIAEGEPGILLLDEFQRYRTIDDKRRDLKVERFQDVWTLLSDGRLPPALSALENIGFRLAQAQYDAAREREDREDDDDAKPPRARQFRLDAWDARELKRALKLAEPLTTIMAWPPEQVQARLHAFRRQSERWETDYSRLLIFVTGNLDEMYEHMAQRVQDCDTDADIFHAMSRKLTVIDVKAALAERFRPEQVARLGNQHIIYPSLSRAAYQRLIAHSAAQYVREVQARSGLRFAIGAPVLAAIYDNAVYPAQGTRPVFSTVHAVLGSPLVDAALWALERSVPAHATLDVTLAPGGQALAMHWQGQTLTLPVPFDLHGLRQRASLDLRTLLAVHEAGHGLAYALLLGEAPQEVRINVASFEGGYNSFVPRKAWSRRMWRAMICVTLAGRAAETLVFGPEAVTTGAEHDYQQATRDAARAVRHHGFGQRVSRTDVAQGADENLNTDVAPTNAEIETLLAAELARAQALLAKHRTALRALVEHLLAHGSVAAADFARISGIPAPVPGAQGGALEPWHEKWQAFAATLQP